MKPIGILLGDVHLCHTPPASRAGEPSWYEAMARPLIEVVNLSDTYGQIPVICAGDLGDKWTWPPELLSFAIRHLPHRFYAVPGQHDLRNHVYEDIGVTAFWTLVEAGVVTLIPPGRELAIGFDLHLYGFPWGTPPAPIVHSDSGVHLAVCHAYIWQAGRGYEGAPEDRTVGAYRKALAGYNAAVFGDNHLGFDAKAGDCNVFNCGAFMYRRSDEKTNRPAVGLLYPDGTIKRHYLDTSKDVFTPTATEEPVPRNEKQAADFTALVAELTELGEGGLDFKVALRRTITARNLELPVASKLLESIGG